ncbi:hypothetical protein [Reichenbachiella versicolor]|uniref:hypothetical protein n=1 Tax=Reichenbachiella versicolor TaxID=1821036 RepID=UPI000D6E4646|nr:hypothetical protein [Reichenbachiella versicolor]
MADGGDSGDGHRMFIDRQNRNQNQQNQLNNHNQVVQQSNSFQRNTSNSGGNPLKDIMLMQRQPGYAKAAADPENIKRARFGLNQSNTPQDKEASKNTKPIKKIKSVWAAGSSVTPKNLDNTKSATNQPVKKSNQDGKKEALSTSLQAVQKVTEGEQASKAKSKGSVRSQVRQQELANRDSKTPQGSSAVEKAIGKRADAVGDMGKTFAAGLSIIPQALKNEFNATFKGDGAREELSLPEVQTSKGEVTFGSGQHSQTMKDDFEVVGNDIVTASEFAAGGVAGELVAGASKVAPYVGEFVFDASTAGVSQSIGKFSETGEISFKPGEIDLANSFFKALLSSKLGDSNKLFKTLKPIIEEGLKTTVDFTAKEGFRDLGTANELLAEFGLRLAFKTIPNKKDEFKRNIFNTTQLTVLEITKKELRNEARDVFKQQETNTKQLK